jgi:hypothetical protein
MRNSTKIIVAAVSLASLAAASIVSAHPGGAYGMGHGQGMGPGAGMMERGHGMGPGGGMGPGYGMAGMHGFDSPAVATARLGDMKAALKITPTQEAAWTAYAAQVQQQMETRQAFHAAMLARMQEPNATFDHEAQHEAMSRLFAAQAEARTALYAVLTPEQQQVFDGRWGPGHGPHMGHMGNMGPMGPMGRPAPAPTN